MDISDQTLVNCYNKHLSPEKSQINRSCITAFLWKNNENDNDNDLFMFTPSHNTILG